MCSPFFISRTQQEQEPAPTLQELQKKAALLKSQGKVQAALDLLSAPCKRSSQEDRICISYVRLLAQTGKWKEAEEVLQRLLAQNPKEAEYHRVLGYVFLNQGRLRLSVWHSTQAWKLDPTHPSALVNLAQSLARQGKHGRAEFWLKQAIKNGAKEARTYYFLSRAQASQQKYKAALLHIRKAYQVSEKNPKYLCLFGELLVFNQNYAKGENKLHQCLRQNPTRKTALVLLARAQMERRLWKDAQKTGRTLLKKGLSKQALPVLIVSNLKLKKYDECLLYSQEARKREISMRNLDYFQALCLSHQGRYKEALPFYRSALRSSPDADRLYLNTGVAFDRTGDKEKALFFYKKACATGEALSCRLLKQVEARP